MTTKSDETTTKSDEMTTKSDETTTKSDETTTKSGETTTKTDETTTSKVTTTVVLNKTKASIMVGQSVKLKATVSPGSKKITWTSSKKSVATVSSKGIVTGVKSGKATIKVKTSDGVTAACKVTVKPEPKKISFSKKSVVLKVGKKLKLKYTIT